ncbi:HDIG domain-containing protein [Planctomycetales bacterium]|nr:HDIG domain-containing protein [Planctomycetales bacterium]
MPNITVVPLSALEANQEADVFALLAEKETKKTKTGKPYLLVLFKDSKREIRFPIWSDLPIYEEFDLLQPGMFCKLRAIYRINQYGVNQYNQHLEIHRIRQAVDDDKKDGFDPLMLRPKSPFPLDAMFEELQTIAEKQLGKTKIRLLVMKVLKDNRAAVLTCTAARWHHHCYIGGLLEHTLSVTKIALALVNHYHTLYPNRKKDISRELTIAGAILHDIGKIREYEPEVGSMKHSVEGELLGHAILGRDIVRDAAKEIEVETHLREQLEHIIIAHQCYPDWGAAKPPMSLEAMLVHHADSCDALTGCFWNIFEQDNSSEPLTSKKNVIGYQLLKPAH